MAYLNSRSITPPIECKFGGLQDNVMNALATAGAFVALADGQVQDVERSELVNFVNQRGFVSTILGHEIADTFDARVRQLKERDSAEVIVENLRPLASLSLASIVVRTAERVALADQKLHSSELDALKLIRLVMIALPTKKRTIALPALSKSFQRALEV